MFIELPTKGQPKALYAVRDIVYVYPMENPDKCMVTFADRTCQEIRLSYDVVKQALMEGNGKG